MVWVEPPGQSSPPLGDVTVIADPIVKEALLVSVQVGLLVLVTRIV